MIQPFQCLASGVLRAMLGGCLLSGCAGTHLYRAEQHELALRAETAFREAKLSEAVRGERAVLDQLLEQELAVVRRQTVVRRDARLLALTTATSDSGSWISLQREVAARLLELSGGAADVYALLDASVDIVDERSAMDASEREYELFRQPDDPSLACPAPSAGKTPGQADARVPFDAFQRRCERYLAAQTVVSGFGQPDTEFGRANALIVATERARDAANADAASLKAGAAQAKRAYDAAVKAGKRDELREAEERLASLLGEADKPIEAATALDEQFRDLALAPTIAKLEARRESIGRIVDALLSKGGDASGTPPGELQSELAVAKAAGAMQGYITAARYPEVSVLLLESESLRLRLEAARLRLANAEARLELLRGRRDALIAEVRALNQARMTLDLLTKDGCRTGALTDDFRKGNAKCRELTARALLHFANSWTLGRVAQEEADYRLIAARHSAVVDASENALAQWETLIGVPVSQLVAFHGSGIRAQDIAQFLYALGITTAIATTGK